MGGYVDCEILVGHCEDFAFDSVEWDLPEVPLALIVCQFFPYIFFSLKIHLIC